MAFKNGIHFLQAWSGKIGSQATDNPAPPTFLHVCASETLAKPGRSKIIGPAAHGRYGNAIVRVVAAQDSFVAFGLDPESADAPRALVLAAQPQDFVLPTGYGISWTLA